MVVSIIDTTSVSRPKSFYRNQNSGRPKYRPNILLRDYRRTMQRPASIYFLHIINIFIILYYHNNIAKWNMLLTPENHENSLAYQTRQVL